VPSITTGLAGSITPLKSPPPNNKALFDFAIAGPLAGLTVSIGLLFVGLELTRQMGLDANFPIVPVDLARASSLSGGMIQYFLGKYTLSPGQGPEAMVGLHPFALSGLIGCFINALALLPLGRKLRYEKILRLCIGWFVLIESKYLYCCNLIHSLNLISFFTLNTVDTDGGRISLAMFGRRGAFVTKLFTTVLLVIAGLFGLDDMNLLLAYTIFALVWQRELESPIRNEVDELDFFRGLIGISSAILVGLILIPMTS
jgi:hypothetical protein